MGQRHYLGLSALPVGKWLRAIAVFVLACVLLAATVQAKLVESIVQVPVQVKDMYGRTYEQNITVTLLVDEGLPEPHPIAIINHGRQVLPQSRAKFGRATNITNARWFASMGFLVASPTRVGYGVSGGGDVEYSGECGNKVYPPGYSAAADQTLTVLEYISQRSDVDTKRVLVLGQSYGGTTAITVASRMPPGVLATINFAGGGGGNPETMPMQPCGTVRLKNMFADYGRTARIPTLWIYTENDQWMGNVYPRQWFDAFKSQGGVGEFVLFPPNGKDGHPLFTQDPQAWRTTVLKFLHDNGFPEAMPVTAGERAPLSSQAKD